MQHCIVAWVRPPSRAMLCCAEWGQDHASLQNLRQLKPQTGQTCVTSNTNQAAARPCSVKAQVKSQVKPSEVLLCRISAAGVGPGPCQPADPAPARATDRTDQQQTCGTPFTNQAAVCPQTAQFKPLAEMVLCRASAAGVGPGPYRPAGSAAAVAGRLTADGQPATCLGGTAAQPVGDQLRRHQPVRWATTPHIHIYDMGLTHSSLAACQLLGGRSCQPVGDQLRRHQAVRWATTPHIHIYDMGSTHSSLAACQLLGGRSCQPVGDQLRRHQAVRWAARVSHLEMRG